MFKNLITYLKVLPIITTFYVIEKKVISISNADGVSMEPTIQSGDIVIVDRLSYKLFNSIKKDDIVIAVQPVNPEVSICKRVIEVGGGTVPYGKGIKVPDQHYWLEGDNKKKILRFETSWMCAVEFDFRESTVCHSYLIIEILATINIPIT